MGWFEDNYSDDDYESDDYNQYWSHRTPDGDKYVYGTRKCSKCHIFKDRKDFNKEEASKPASKRICTECGAPLPFDLSILTMDQIRVELTRRGYPVPKGRKNDYIEALQKAVAREAGLRPTSPTRVTGNQVQQYPSAIQPRPTPAACLSMPIPDMAESQRLLPFGRNVGVPSQPFPKATGQRQPQLLPTYLNMLTVARLKNELRKRGLITSGCKKALTERLSIATGIPAAPPPSPSHPPQSRLPPPLPSMIHSVFFQFADLQSVKDRLAPLSEKELAAQLTNGFSNDTEHSHHSIILNWHRDTPLIAAVRGQNAPIVRYLLKIGADPTLRNENHHESAADIASKEQKSAEDEWLGEAKTPRWAHTDPSNLFQSLSESNEIVALLKAATPFWSPRDDSGSRYSDARKANSNRPSDLGKLQAALALVPTAASAGPSEAEGDKFDDMQCQQKQWLAERRKQKAVEIRKNNSDSPKWKAVASKRRRLLVCQGRECCKNTVSFKCSYGCCGTCCKEGTGKACGKCAFWRHA